MVNLNIPSHSNLAKSGSWDDLKIIGIPSSALEDSQWTPNRTRYVMEPDLRIIESGQVLAKETRELNKIL